MHSFFFGERSRQLYGVYHAAAGFGTTVAVICPTLAHEYLESHTTLRRLADLLATRGVHAFRFDYLGTGDSSGRSTDTTLATMTRDAGTAVEEAIALSGAAQALLIGLRLGGNVAARVVGTTPDVAGAVLWDPVLDGIRYLGDLGGKGRNELSDGGVDFAGYALSPEMVRDLESLGADSPGAAPGIVPRYVLVNGADAGRRYRDAGWEVGTFTEAMPWVDGSDFGSTALPVKTLDAVAEIACDA